MKRKKDTAETTSIADSAGGATAVAEPAPSAGNDATPESQAQAGEAPARNWGPPYKSIYSCTAKGFEMGEDRRFRQRVFKFIDKPEEHVLATLKEHGFTYRAAEKSWTVPATAENRVLTDRLAQAFAGKEAGLSL